MLLRRPVCHVTFCRYVLGKSSLQEILVFYPKMQRNMVQVGPRFALCLLFSLMNAGQADAEKTSEMQRALFEHQRAIVSQYVMGSSRCVLHNWRLNSTNLRHTEFAGLLYPSPLMTTARFRVETRLFTLKCNFALLQLLLCVISALF
jgi:hypothetical protein